MNSLYKIDLDEILKPISENFTSEGASEVVIATQYIFNKAREFVPIETGKLYDSGFYDIIFNRGIVGFETPYALYVHEIKENFHVSGRTKYLEDAAIEYIKATNTGLSIKLSLNKNGVYIYVSPKEKSYGIGGMELNVNNFLSESFKSYMKALNLREGLDV